MPKKPSSFLAKTAVEFGSRTTVHGVGYVADSQFPHSIRILWLILSVLCLCLAGYLSHKSYTDWQEDQVITTLKTTARPVTDLSFPTVTICAAGLHMENVKTVLERNFNSWRFQNRKSWDAEDIESMMAEFMRETFQIKEKGINILDLLNMMIYPKVESSLASNGVRENLAACSKQGSRRRKRQVTGELVMEGNIGKWRGGCR